MPSSNLWLAPKLVTYLAELKPRNVLDVGPGHGKYGMLAREYVPSIRRLDAVELEERYVDRFRWLHAIYDDVFVRDVAGMAEDELEPYDVVLMLDVLEHLDYEPARALLRRIAGAVVICTPRDYFQNPEHRQYPSESHRSHWSAASIAEAAGRPCVREDVDALDSGGVIVVIGAR